jgi:hypothetical protein
VLRAVSPIQELVELCEEVRQGVLIHGRWMGHCLPRLSFRGAWPSP